MHLTAVDLLRASPTTRAVSYSGLLLGPPAVAHGTAYLALLTPTSELAVAIDASGSERFRALLAMHSPGLAADGGVSMPVAPPHTPPLVDRSGTVVSATIDGSIAVTKGAVVETLGERCEPPVAPSRATPPVAGMAPLDPDAFVAACQAGAVLAIRGRGP
jgi:hypothetical protein